MSSSETFSPEKTLEKGGDRNPASFNTNKRRQQEQQQNKKKKPDKS